MEKTRKIKEKMGKIIREKTRKIEGKMGKIMQHILQLPKKINKIEESDSLLRISQPKAGG